MKQIRTLLKNSDLDAVFKILNNSLLEGSELQNQLTIVESSYNHIQTEVTKGTLSVAEVMTNMSKINSSVLSIINKFESSKDSNFSKYEEQLGSMFHTPDLINDGILLSSLYVEPHFQIYKQFVKNSSDSQLQTDQFIEFRLGLVDFLSSSQMKNSIVQDFLFNKVPLTIIMGQPGQGKSSLCKAYLNTLYNQRLEGRNSDLFLFLRLRDIRDVESLITEPLESIKRVVEGDIWKRTGVKLVIDYARFINSTIILDGLDELEMLKSEKLSELNVLQFITNLNEELLQCNKNNNKISVIITSRFGRVRFKDLLRRKIFVLKISDFSLNHQIEWLEKAESQNLQPWLTREHLDKYNSNLSKYKHINELLGQPILLGIISKLKIEPENIKSRSELYDIVFKSVIHRLWDDGFTLDINEVYGLDPNSLRKILSEVAFEIHKTGKGFITQDHLINSKSPVITNFFTKNPKVDSDGVVLQHLMMCFYMQSSNDNNNLEYASSYSIEFLHKSLMEFLVSEYLWQQIKHTFISKNFDNLGNQYIDKTIQVLRRLFDQIEYSDQIRKYIKYFIFHELKEDKEDMFVNISKSLKLLIDHDFSLLNENSSAYELTPKRFYGLWDIYSSLNDDHGVTMNYLNIFYLDRIFEYIKTGGLSSMNFSNIEFDSSDFHGIEFNDFHFKECSFNQVTFTHCVFIDCILSGIDLSESAIVNCWFINCKIHINEMIGSFLFNSSFVFDSFTNHVKDFPIFESSRNDLTFAESTLEIDFVEKSKLIKCDLSDKQLEDFSAFIK